MIFCTFFKKCDQSPDGFSNFFRSGGNQGIVQLDRKYDQYNLCQGSRVVKVNLTVINALLDDLGQSGFQLTDQMFEILMVEKWQKPYVRSSFRRQRNLETEMQFVIKPKKRNCIKILCRIEVSPEELENKIGEHRLVQEILVRESNGVIEAEIFPDYEYAKKKEITEIQAVLQEVVDDYNKTAPAHKRVYSLKVRETEFEKTPSRKIKRY